MGNYNKKNLSYNIDEDLYSRQIICLGIETMKKISQLKILIIGLRGLGIEIAKNIIVSGPKSVTIFDPNKIEINDLGSNFYLLEKDIGKRRDESCLCKLKKLNKYVQVNYLRETNINDIYNKLSGNYNVIIVSEMLPQKDIIQLDNISRNNKICFIYSVICGLCSFVFTDFGKNFTIYDEYCAKKRKYYIKNIEKSKEGLVSIQWNGKGNPNIQEYILFKDVEGMIELNYDENKKNIYKITPKDETSFYIGNTSSFSEYTTGGYIEETALPQIMNYKNFKETLDEPFIDINSYKNHKKKFIFLIFKALMIFFDKKKRLPLQGNNAEYEEIKNITKSLYESINYEKSKSFVKDELKFDEKLILNICSTSRAEIPSMTSVIGGIVSQEILKVTGKFKPINQWEILNFSQYSSIIPEQDKNFKSNFIRNKNRYEDLTSVFGEKVVSIIQNLNIILAGAGAVGCELIKNISLLGITSCLVIDDDSIEISNLNRQFLFHEENKGKSKALIASKSAKEINPDCNYSYLNKRISPENKYIFNKSYFDNVNFVLGAIDSSQGNYYLSRQCELYDKILIKGATGGPSGKVQTFIPQKTGSYNDIPNVPDDDQEKLPSCTRREFPGKIEDCIDNARDLFDDYYVTIVDDILKLLDPNEKFLQLEVNMSLDKFNIIKNYFFLIKSEFNRKKNLNNNNIVKKSKFIFYNSKKKERSNDIEKEFIKFGLLEFEKLFISKIQEIYISHPIDDTEESKAFWVNKRKPSELLFNIENELCFTFLFNFLYICSKLLNIPFENNEHIFKQKIIEVINEKNYKQSEELIYINDSEVLYNKIVNEINNIKKEPELLEVIKSLTKINFEKDIPELGHVQFIYSYSNLKAKTYKIPECNKYYALEYVGKIAPTTITSTAVVAGLMCLQMIGIIINQLYIWPRKKNLEIDENEFDEELIETGLHNFCINLKSNEYDFESLSSIEYKGVWNLNDLIPNKYSSSWYKIIERGNKTIKEFIEYIKEKYGIEATLILSAEDDRDIYEKISAKKKTKKALEKKRLMDNILNQKIGDIYYNTAKNICNEYEKENELFLKVKGIDSNGSYIETPIIKYII
jgi:ubiquitin-activating enzyme E1